MAKATALSGEKLQRLMELIAGADTVELKLTIPETTRAASSARSASIRSTHRSGRSSSSTRPTSS